MWRVPRSQNDALGWFLERVPMTREELGDLQDYAKRQAFIISHVAELDVIVDTMRSLEGALGRGDSFEEWRETVGDQLEAAWNGSVKNPGSRLETIYRNALQSSYNQARVKQMSDPAVTKARPYWVFDALLDDRVSDICESRNGVTLRHDDPWWGTNTPPLHHNCRSSIRTLTEAQANARGITDNPGGDPVSGGFGTVQPWPGDSSQAPSELKEIYERKVTA